jgi:hypothetical protein
MSESLFISIYSMFLCGSKLYSRSICLNPLCISMSSMFLCGSKLYSRSHMSYVV